MKSTLTKTENRTIKYPYWTPAGIVMDEPPPAYAALWNDGTERDWDELLTPQFHKKNSEIRGKSLGVAP